MSCEYKKYIDSLLAGKLNDTKLKELEEHAKECKECSDKLHEIRKTDEIIKNELNKYPFVSNKNKIMNSIENKKCSRILPILYKSRKYLCGIAAVIILVFSIQLVKPYFNKVLYTAKNNKAKPANNTPSIKQDQNTVIIGGHKLKINMPANWTFKMDEHNDISFYEDGINCKAVLSILDINKECSLMENITPTHSDTLLEEEINVPLGKGKLAAFGVKSVAHPPKVVYEFAVIIPFSKDQAYEIHIITKDASNASKNLVMSILNGISYDNVNEHNNTNETQNSLEQLLSLLNIVPTKNYKIDKSQKTYYKITDGNGNNIGEIYADTYKEDFDLLAEKPNHSSVTKDEYIDIPLGKCRLITLDADNGTAASGIIGTHDVYYAEVSIKEKAIYILTFTQNDRKPETKNQFIEMLKNLTLADMNNQAKKHNEFGNIDKDNITSFKISNYKAIFKEINNKADRNKIIDLLNNIKVLESGVGVPDGMGYAVEITYSNGENLTAAFVTSTGGYNMLYTSDGKSTSCYVDKNMQDELKKYYDKY